VETGSESIQEVESCRQGYMGRGLERQADGVDADKQAQDVTVPVSRSGFLKATLYNIVQSRR
jgi:hypothetical protein